MKKYKRKIKEAKNIDVVEAFVLDHSPNLKLRVRNIVINSTDIGLVLVNYSTGIALRVPDADGWKIILNKKKYSMSTSTIQNMIRL